MILQIIEMPLFLYFAAINTSIMKGTLCFICCVLPVLVFCQPANNHFFEIHYTETAYNSPFGSARNYNSGFGATVNRQLGRHASIELFYDNAWVKEQPRDAAFTGGHVEYRSVVQTLGIRAGFGRTEENWSVNGIAGIGVRLMTAEKVDSCFQSQPTRTYRKPGTFQRAALDLGVRSPLAWRCMQQLMYSFRAFRRPNTRHQATPITESGLNPWKPLPCSSSMSELPTGSGLPENKYEQKQLNSYRFLYLVYTTRFQLKTP